MFGATLLEVCLLMVSAVTVNAALSESSVQAIHREAFNDVLFQTSDGAASLTFYNKYANEIPDCENQCALRSSRHDCSFVDLMKQVRLLNGMATQNSLMTFKRLHAHNWLDVGLARYLSVLQDDLENKETMGLLKNDLQQIMNNQASHGSAMSQYFSSLAQYDIDQANADIGFAQGRLNELKKGVEEHWATFRPKITEILIAAMFALTGEVAEDTAKLVADTGDCFNPIAVVTGGCDPSTIMDRSADLADSVARFTHAFELSLTIGKLGRSASELSGKFAVNKEFLDTVNHFYDDVDAMRTDVQQNSNKFLKMYSDYSPEVTMQDIERVAVNVAYMAETACDLLKSTHGVSSAVVQVITEAVTNHCDGFSADAAVLQSYYEDLFEFQFELIDALASAVRGQLALSHKTNLQQSNNRLIIDSLVSGMFLDQIKIQEICSTFCNVIEYQSGGQRPDVCKRRYFQKDDINQLTAFTSIKSIHPSTKHDTVTIPTAPKYNGDLSFINVTQLLAGKPQVFTIPQSNNQNLISQGWVDTIHDIDETSHFVKKFEIFAPDLECEGTGGNTITVTVLSHEHNKLFNTEASSSYTIPNERIQLKYEINSDASCQTSATNPSSSTGDSVCMKSNGVIHTDSNTMFPSIFSTWTVSLVSEQTCTLKQPETASIKANVELESITNDVDNCWPNPCMNGGTCTDGKGSYTCTCPPNTAGQNCDVEAFSVGRNTNVEAGSNGKRLIYDTVLLNSGGFFNQTASEYVAETNGYYYVEVTVTSIKRNDIWVELRTNSKTYGLKYEDRLYEKYRTLGPDTRAKGVVVSLRKGEKIYVFIRSEGAIQGESDKFQIALSGFKVPDQNNVFFGTSNKVETSGMENAVYDNVVVSEGIKLVDSNTALQAQSAGVYFISASRTICAETSRYGFGTYVVLSYGHTREVPLENNGWNGQPDIGKATYMLSGLVELSAGHKIKIQGLSGNLGGCGEEEMEFTMSMFRISVNIDVSPSANVPQGAYFAAVGTSSPGPSEPVVLESPYIDSEYNKPYSKSNIVLTSGSGGLVAPAKGIYYIGIEVHFYQGDGCGVMVDGKVVAEAIQTNNDNPHNINRGVVVKLEAGSTIALYSTIGYSDAKRCKLFGFLIHESD